MAMAPSVATTTHCVIPAKAGIQMWRARRVLPWIPAFAGMTECVWQSEGAKR